MVDLRKEIFKYYKVFRTTSMVDGDIKSLKKINNLITKFTNTDKDRYEKEAINIMKTTANLVDFNLNFVDLVKSKMIAEENQPIFDLFVQRVI